MIGKLLLTLVVIALAVVYLRKRYQLKLQKDKNKRSAGSSLPTPLNNHSELEQFLTRARNSQSPAAPVTGALAPRLRAILWIVLGGLLVIAATGSYLYWQDQQQLVTVLLHRDVNEAPVIYRVEKRNLGDKEFVTDTGIRVTVSANERMEVVGL
ncbi:MAG: hypothetical protein Q8S94_17245 [Pseudohongiella sp.]|nr:hypothetical protein [Pseudohongiella sp.]